MTVRDTFLATSLLLQVFLPAVTASWLAMFPERSRTRHQAIGIGCLVAVSLLATPILMSTSTKYTVPSTPGLMQATDGEDVPATGFARGTLFEVSVDQNRAGLLTLAAWLSLTGLLLTPQKSQEPSVAESAAILWLHGGTALFLCAEHVILFLSGWSIMTWAVASLLHAPSSQKSFSAAALFSGVQIAGMMTLAAGLAVTTGTVGLMQSAPSGPPQPVVFSLQGLADLLNDSAGRHPAAAEIHTQLSDWLLLAISLSVCVSAALFPFHGWLTRVWDEAPLAVRIWLGGIGLKLPILRLQPVISSYLGASLAKFLLLLALSGLAGSVVISCVAAADKRRSITLVNLVLMTSVLTALLVPFGEEEFFLPVTGLAAGVVLLVTSFQNNSQENLWRFCSLVLATLAIGFVPGGIGFALWKGLISQVWIGMTPVSGGWFPVLVLSAVITTVALLQLFQTSDFTKATRTEQESADLSDRQLLNTQAVTLAWGGVVVLLSAMSVVSMFEPGRADTMEPPQEISVPGGNE